MSNKSAHLAIVSKNTLETKKAVDVNDYYICNALQTTLEFNELLAIFSAKIQNFVPHSGYTYDNPEFDLSINSGITTAHSFTYALKFEEQSLGEVKLMRSKRFLNAEVKKLETLLVMLCYPLKNATLYHQALKMAYTDPLTKVSNRTAFDDTINRELQLAKRSGRNLSIIFLDIDHFKALNDKYGHACGDFALSSVASWIKQATRETDIVFRYGGEEFVVVLSDTNKEGAEVIAERIRNEINSHTLAYGVNVLDITASLGVSTLEAHDSCNSLVQRADQAMYAAKQNGRNQVMAA